MATAFTHALTAVGVTTLAPRSLPRSRLAISMAVLAVLPDLDVIGFRLGIAYSHALGHRGFTHSIVFAALAAVVTAVVIFPRVRRGSSDWWKLIAFLFVATISHGILDAFTDAGLGVGFLIPFDDGRYFAPWRPLATSPLSVSAFFDGPALRILLNELLWVGGPLTVLLAAWHGLRRSVTKTAPPGLPPERM